MDKPDLSKYEYESNVGLNNAVNVGMISERGDFVPGQNSEQMLLSVLRVSQNPIFIRRSFHACRICKLTFAEYSIKYNYQNIHICRSNADIVVRDEANGITYVSPIQLFHYMRDHCYVPPRYFLSALERIHE